MKPNTKLEIAVTTDWEEDDTVGPPSPPPAHLIYFPETYAGTKSWQQRNTVSTHRAVHPIQTFILLLATVSHLLVRFQKIGYKWAAHTVRNMGGLDSVVLALSAIIFAKSIQRTNRII
ncbi:hypothetical protein HPULCUR_006999 [Helicostylum pulchrum]|uniref:Uncharacterized protein n=1 Tax=Helicostylum pulchrum TaxID=562976 RepID=A0ABP9Y3L7_9FUNG